MAHQTNITVLSLTYTHTCAMPSEYIDTQEKLDNALRHWKDFTFDKSYSKLQSVVDSMKTPKRMVEARTVGPSGVRWTVCSDRRRAAASLTVRLPP